MAVHDHSSSPFPDYSQMVMGAIEELNEKEGSTKEAILEYIESNFSDLSPSHVTHVTHTLEKLRQTGQLLMLKDDSYIILKTTSTPPSQPNGLSIEPIKRGRGRPPKPKSDLPPSAVAPSSPRPRGRPPKPRDPLAPNKPNKPPSSGRPRGRPRKSPQKDGPGSGFGPGPAVVGVKRGRGRPPKKN